jgi:hypothetical protein
MDGGGNPSGAISIQRRQADSDEMRDVIETEWPGACREIAAANGLSSLSVPLPRQRSVRAPLVEYRAVTPLSGGVQERGPYDLVSLLLCENFTALCFFQVLLSS